MVLISRQPNWLNGIQTNNCRVQKKKQFSKNYIINTENCTLMTLLAVIMIRGLSVSSRAAFN